MKMIEEKANGRLVSDVVVYDDISESRGRRSRCRR